MKSKIGPYIFLEDLGKGSFCTVKLVKHKEFNIKLACKIFNKNETNSQKLARMQFENEVRIIHQLCHPGVVALADLLSDDQNYYVLMQYCPGKSLLNHILKHGPIEEDKAKILFKQIVETLEYLQKNGVSHRDLKPENILFTNKKMLIFIDFGFSRFVEQPTDIESNKIRKNLVNSRLGSADYASPEIVSGGNEPYDGFASDIWSCGVILYEMVTRRRPWKPTVDIKDIISQITNGEYEIPTYLSDSCQDLIKRMLTINPDKRITLKEISEHKWLNDVPTQYDVANHEIKTSVTITHLNKFLGLESRTNSLSIIKPVNNPSSNNPNSNNPNIGSHPHSNKRVKLQPYTTSNQITTPHNPAQPLLGSDKVHIVLPPTSYRHGHRRIQKIKLTVDTHTDSKPNLFNSTGGQKSPIPPAVHSPKGVPYSKSPRRYALPNQAMNPRHSKTKI